MKLLAILVLLSLPFSTGHGQSDDDVARKRILEVAFKYRGVPYVYGSESPQAFDCSGFVRYVYREAYGVELPRSARGFYSAGTSIDAKAAKPGDVYVYDTVGGAPSHVAIFVGDGTVIHAVSDGPKTGVIVSPLADKYWAPRLIAARRFVVSATGAAVATAPQPAATGTKAAATAAQPAATAAKPGATSAKPATAAARTSAAPDELIVDIGLTIPAVKETFTDKIPTAAGTSIAFTLTNGTGKDASFIVVFFRVDPKTYKLQQIHEEKIKLLDKGNFALPPYRFELAGKYRLIVKDSWGNQLFERSFVVTGAQG